MTCVASSSRDELAHIDVVNFKFYQLKENIPGWCQMQMHSRPKELASRGKTQWLCCPILIQCLWQALVPRLKSDCITANVTKGKILKDSVWVEKAIILSQLKVGWCMGGGGSISEPWHQTWGLRAPLTHSHCSHPQGTQWLNKDA